MVGMETNHYAGPGGPAPQPVTSPSVSSEPQPAYVHVTEPSVPAPGGWAPPAGVPSGPQPSDASTKRLREKTLDTANSLINGDRDASYGDALESFQRLAKIWSGILGTDITPAQVAMCLAGLKLSRLSVNANHQDSWVDLAGYAALGSEVAARTETPAAPDQV